MVDAGASTFDLSATPLAERLVELQRDRASGELVLERGRSRKVLGMLEGGLVSVESSLPSESLCARLEDAGKLDSESGERARTLASKPGATQASALAGLGLLDPKQLFCEIRDQIAACTREAMLWTDGRAHFDASSIPPEATRAFRCDLQQLVHAALCATWPAERMATDLAPHFKQHPSAREGFGDRVRRWIDDAAAVRLVSLLDGDRTVEAVIGATFSEPPLLAALWVADRSGLLGYADSARSEPEAELPPEIEIEVLQGTLSAQAAAAEKQTPSASPAVEAPESAELRKEVESLHEQLSDWTHYEILGVEPRAKPAAIKKAYFTAAKRYHPDKLSRLGLDELRDRASELFAAIAEAYEVLSDAKRRDDYDAALASGGALEDVDVTRLAQAESFFRKGEVLIKMGDFRAACELLETTVELWPDECVYQATLGWARFRKNPPDNDGAAEALRLAVKIGAENAQAHYWLGQVLRAMGDVNGSAEHAARARKLDPSIG